MTPATVSRIRSMPSLIVFLIPCTMSSWDSFRAGVARVMGVLMPPMRCTRCTSGCVCERMTPVRTWAGRSRADSPHQGDQVRAVRAIQLWLVCVADLQDELAPDRCAQCLPSVLAAQALQRRRPIGAGPMGILPMPCRTAGSPLCDPMSSPTCCGAGCRCRGVPCCVSFQA